MDALQFLRSNSEYLTAISNAIVETGLTFNGKFIQESKGLSNQQIGRLLKSATVDELIAIIDSCGLTPAFESATPANVSSVQATSMVDLTGEDVREFTSTNSVGITTTVPIVMCECIGLSTSGKSLQVRMKSGKIIDTQGESAFKLYVAGALKDGDLVAMNPSTIRPASYAIGRYTGGMNITACDNAREAYKARAKNVAIAKAWIADAKDQGLSHDEAKGMLKENVKTNLGLPKFVKPEYK